MTTNTYDCIVVGAGPAGLSASLLLARYRRRVVTFHTNTPRNIYSHGVHGFLGHDGVLPAELLRIGAREVRAYGGIIVDERVEKASAAEENLFRVRTPSQELLTRTILLASGLRDFTPRCPGFLEFYGRSVHHCPDCDGFESTDKRIAVLALADRADEFARGLLPWTRKLTLVVEDPGPDVASEFPVIRKTVTSLEGDIESGRLQRVCFADGSHLDCDALFFSLGVTPSSDLHEQLGCEVDASELVTVDRRQQTTVRGVWAAGDLTAASQLAIVAAAEGAMAAIHIHKTLVAEKL